MISGRLKSQSSPSGYCLHSVSCPFDLETKITKNPPFFIERWIIMKDAAVFCFPSALSSFLFVNLSSCYASVGSFLHAPPWRKRRGIVLFSNPPPPHSMSTTVYTAPPKLTKKVPSQKNKSILVQLSHFCRLLVSLLQLFLHVSG